MMIIPVTSCKQADNDVNMRIVFLHHSTGQFIWNGNRSSLVSRAIRKFSTRLSRKFNKKAGLPLLFANYNEKFHKNYHIEDEVFPKASPYGWHNYPYDYYNIWVRHAGNKPFMEEPTLEMLTKKYQVIIFKHCFPVSSVQINKDSADINSDYKSIANYKLQYMSLRDKLHEFSETKFIIWTGAALVKSQTNEEEAKRSQEFFKWVTEEWDLPGDNIFVWDFYSLQTEGGLYFLDKYARSVDDSHPNYAFSDCAGRLLFNRIVDVITSNGSTTSLTGELKKYTSL
jgi:hypothetical protein